MMKHAIVIGANYGDEGKGLMTRYLAAKLKAERVVRFNGGVQAGHTIVHNGMRFINSAFGSGTQLGIQTEFASTAILHPGVARKEQDFLRANGIQTHRIVFDPQCLITTPIDQMINQLVETKRGNNRHGSCGMGINETIKRAEFFANHEPLSFGTNEFYDRISREWLPQRLKFYDFSQDEINEVKKIIDGPARNLWMQNIVEAFGPGGVYLMDLQPRTSSPLVYEGAQGLALDRDMGSFPHVTNSNTGIKNALLHLSNKPHSGERERVEIVYCSRAYLTRHGNGPLPHENLPENIMGTRPWDPTNEPNRWQGTIRFAPLDLFDLVQRIEQDLNRNASVMGELSAKYQFAPVLALTCLDQAEEFLVIPKLGANPVKMKSTTLSDFIQDTYRLKVRYESFGASSNDVIEYSSSSWSKIFPQKAI